MYKTLMIPQNIKVGFQNREDTYTKKLAYITYTEKGKIKKESSWNNWKDSSISVEDYENVPMEGFVLNKKVGDCKTDNYYGFRKAYIRVYDPRGFEFEITIDNLIFILEYCPCIPGKGLEGKFIYSWDGTNLILLPINSPDYKEAIKYNKNLLEVRDCNNLIPGYTYLNQKHEEVIFLGIFDYYDSKNNYKKEIKKSTRYYFANIYQEKPEIHFRFKAITKSTAKNYILNIVSDIVNEHFDEMINAIQYKECVSPVDYENVKLKSLTFDDFIKRILNKDPIMFYYKGIKMMTNSFQYKDTNKTISIIYGANIDSNVPIICNYSKYKPENKVILIGTSSGNIEFNSLKEFYDVMKPKRPVWYLENGKEYYDGKLLNNNYAFYRF